MPAVSRGTDRTDPPYIAAAEIRRLTPIRALVETLRDAFARDETIPPRQQYQLPGDSTLLLMPAWRSGGDAGVKIVTVYPHASPSVQATYVLISGEDGRPKAVMDGAMLTARRTAAASALAADMLARTDAATLLMLGTGTLAPHLIEAHCSIRPIRRVLLWGRDYRKAQVLAEQLGVMGLQVSAVADRLAAIPQADIISAATLSSQPLVLGQLVKAGTHVDLVGAFRPDMCEADVACLGRGRVFVDTRKGVLEEGGDVIQAIAAGAMRRENIEADLLELCSGRHAGRAADQAAITIFKSVGAAIEDLAAAERVFASWNSQTPSA
ncbi:MAG TPA: ornithine cyclodeaminase family protein [Steroidobacteraceae bacterium]|jgi:ornithine cyclodeaminase